MCGGRTEPPSTSSGLAEPINIGTNTTRKELVLVTGGTGYVASHCVEAALDKGYAGMCSYACTRVMKEAIKWFAVLDILGMILP